MKKLVTLALLLPFFSEVFATDPPVTGPVHNAAVLNTVIFADEDTTPDGWKFGGFASLQVNQVALVNWNAGGENSFSGTILATGFARFKKNGWLWNTALDIGYGQLYSKSFGWQKNEDRLNLLSTVTKKIGKSEKFSYTGELNFRTQFAPGFQLPNDSVAISRFMAPGYLILTVGITYQPAEWISFYLSPATGKFTFVMDEALSSMRAFGVDSGKVVNPEFGAFFRMTLAKDIFKNVSLMTSINLFNNYTDKDPVNRRMVDVDWQTSINMKVNKFLVVSLFTHLIYDYDIKQLVFDGENPVWQTNEQGQFVTDADGNKMQKRDALVQFKEVLGLGISYKF